MAISSRPVLAATRARSGRLGRHMFWVLLVSTLLAAIALFAAWTWRSGELTASEPTMINKSANAQAFDTPAPITPPADAPR